jgi:pimeloyl-ACP methyl ester carboxylesterase
MSAVLRSEVNSTNVRVAKRVERLPPLGLAAKTMILGLRMSDQISPALAARLAEHVFFSPRRYRRPTREWQLVAQGRSFTFRAAEVELTGWEWGTGPTVLLVHGWEGRGTQLGSFIAPLVERGYRVVAFDAPAHGASAGKRTNVFQLAESIRAIADRQARPLAGIVAHSLGAAATSLAVRAGMPVLRLVYVAPWCTLSRAVESFGSRIGLSQETCGRMRSDIERTFRVPWDQVDGDVIAKDMSAPLLIIHDADDADIPVSEGERLAASWPGADLLRTSGHGHRRILRAPEVVAAATRYLSGDTAPAHTDEWQALVRPEVQL